MLHMTLYDVLNLEPQMARRQRSPFSSDFTLAFDAILTAFAALTA